MRTKNAFGPRHGGQLMPRMSWHPKSLYNILHNATHKNPATPGMNSSTVKTIFQQQFVSRRLVRAYHGDHIPEKRFKRFLLPVSLPSYIVPQASAAPRPGGMFQSIRRPQAAEKKLPIASLLVREIERRADTCVFRLCFARSVWEARNMILRGHVKLNGTKMTDPGHLMNPGDLISVDPRSIPLLKSTPTVSAVSESKDAEDSAEAAEGENGEESMEANAEASGQQAAEENAGGKEEGKSDEAEPVQEAKTEAEEVTQAEAAVAASEGGEKESKGTLEEQKAAKRAAREAAADAKRADRMAGVKVREEEKSAERQRLAVEKEKRLLESGVLRFEMPPFAGPHLFIPPYLEVSWSTCSGIYLRHPTLTRSADGRTIRSDVPSPWSADSEAFALAWEFYVRRSPRTRGDQRRLKLEAKVGRNGFVTARAKDAWNRMKAKRRGWTTRTGEALVTSRRPKVRLDSSRAKPKVKAPQLRRQRVATAHPAI